MDEERARLLEELQELREENARLRGRLAAPPFKENDGGGSGSGGPPGPLLCFQREMLDTAAIWINTLDAEGNVAFWNCAAEHISGYSREEVLGHGRVWEWLYPDPEYRERVFGAALRVIRSGRRSANVETTIRRRDGEPRTLSWHTNPLVDESGTAVGSIAFAADITDRRRAEAALGAREEEDRRFRDHLLALHEVGDTLLHAESLDDLCRQAVALGRERLGFDRLSIWFLDPDAPGCAVGSFGTDEYGNTRDERGCRIALNPGLLTDSGFARDARVVIRRGVALCDEATRPVGEGSLAVAAILDGEEVAGALYADNLLTGAPIDRRRGELLVLYAATIGHLVRHLRAEGIRRHAEALAEADRRKDEFLAILAHELRDPLAAIGSAVDVLRLRCPGDPALNRARDAAGRQVRHMARLLDDLLDLSRITRGTLELRRRPVALATVLAEAIETVTPLVEQRRHDLSLMLPPHAVRMNGDPDRLRQVFGNLLSNAARYTEPGGRIRLEASVEAGEALLRVRDSGAGIAPEFLPSVFEPFAQWGPLRGRSQGGLGLGLSLVRRLVELHGGRVDVFSDGPGRGSEFVVRLPLALESGAPDPEEADAPLQASGPAPGAARRRVLVVDDNADAAGLVAELLEMFGHEAVVAHDGPTALALAAGYEPDTVLLDIELPEIDGYEVARRLRAHPGTARALLIATTGRGQEEDRRQSLDAGFDHHLTKPFEMADLLRLLAETPAETASGAGDDTHQRRLPPAGERGADAHHRR